MHASYILSALAAVGLASAQCSNSATMTIQNGGDATALASCQTYSGSIAIATNAADDINLDGLSAIDGNLVVNNNKGLSTLGADSIQTITGSFTLTKVFALSTLNFPQLSSVGSIDWATLPQLSGVSLDTGISKADSVSITDTKLADLTALKFSSIDSLILQSNGVVNKLSLPVQKVTDVMTITANTDGGADSSIALSLPNLQFGKDFNFQGLSSYSAPNLQGVNGSWFMSECDVESLEMPKLTSVGATLTITKNPKLSEFSFPKLTSVSGGFVFGSCPDVDKVDGLDKLSTIGGNLDFTGNFEDVALPALSVVKGTFNMQSTGDIEAECKKFRSVKGINDVIRGPFKCIAEDSTPENINGQTSSGSTGGKGDGTEISGDGSDASFVLPSLLTVGVATVFSAILGFF